MNVTYYNERATKSQVTPMLPRIGAVCQQSE